MRRPKAEKITSDKAATHKAYRRGTHRAASPAQTIARFAGFGHALGITRVADITGLDYLGVPVFLAMRPNGRSLSVSQGKGLDADSAYVSAFMEASELEHAGNAWSRATIASSAALSARVDVADLTSLPRLRGARLSQHTEIPWIEARDLFTEMPVRIPYELVHMDFTVPARRGCGYFFASSNGLASGNHLLEAICSGLCETIERDATRLWRRRDARDRARRRLNLASVRDRDCRALIDRLSDRRMKCAIWDATSDIGIACFICRLNEAAGNHRSAVGAAWGAGCHPDRSIALVRAITEAVQSRLTVIAGSRDDLRRDDYGGNPGQSLIDLLTDAFEEERSGRRFEEVPDFDNETFEDDLALLLQHLSAVGLRRAYVVDLTDARFGIPVVRVVVPGLETDSHKRPFPQEGARARALRKGMQ